MKIPPKETKKKRVLIEVYEESRDILAQIKIKTRQKAADTIEILLKGVEY